jgi:hypothetical protein
MADTYGNLYFSWVQCSLRCIPDATRISENSIQQSALGIQPFSSFNLTRVHPCLSAVGVFSVPPRLRGGVFSACQNGGRP